MTNLILMTCSYGPYKITSSLEAVGEFVFINKELSRRVAILADCAKSLTPPCFDAVSLHTKDDCPDGCKISWYECPSEMGRQYTILPTPCGVTVTSFEDGLIAIGDCDATAFGSETFCFGKIYTNLGTFESPDQSRTTFEFDGHTFSVQGKLGDCNELYNCTDCQTDSQLVAFENLPTPPKDISAPEPSVDNEVISDVDTPETKVIPAEDRVDWNWEATANEFGQDTLCEDEKPLITGTSIPTGASNDNPAIATLPSGHTVVAYENRKEDGIAKIAVAVLSSSVGENIRSHRKLGTGTLVNNLLETNGIGTFIIYEEMDIFILSNKVPSFGEKIGFLTGPLAGTLSTITEMTRIRDGDIIRHEFIFSVPPAMLEDVQSRFPDKNNVYNVGWFIVDNSGSRDLPSSTTIATIFDLYHIGDDGTNLPVANPAIAVASNNLMVANEQNIYVAYQAFEYDQWRVYLREIVLGGESEINPTYMAPYLFGTDADPGQRQIETMSSNSMESFAIDAIRFEDNFVYNNIPGGTPLVLAGRWNQVLIRDMFMADDPQDDGLITSKLTKLCGLYPQFNCGEQTKVCRAVHGISECPPNSTPVNNQPLAMITLQEISEDIKNGDKDFLKTETSLRISVIERTFSNSTIVDSTMVPIIFLIGRTRQETKPPPGESPDKFTHLGDFWKIVIDGYNTPSIGNFGVIRVWLGTYNKEQPTVGVLTPDIKALVTTNMTSTNFPQTGKVVWRVVTFVRGRHRIFEVHVGGDMPEPRLIVTFRVPDESVYDYLETQGSPAGDTLPISLGGSYGYGLITAKTRTGSNPTLGNFNFIPFAQAPALAIVTADRFFVASLDDKDGDAETLYETWFDQKITGNFLDSFESRFFQQWTNRINGDWTSTGRTRDFLQPGENLGANTWFPTETFGSHTNSAILTAGKIGLINLEVPADFRRNIPIPGNSPLEFVSVMNVSLYARVSRLPSFSGIGDGSSQDGTWPNVWFLLRRTSGDPSDWTEGWRIRVRHYTIGGIRKWRVSLYDGDTSLESGNAEEQPVRDIEVNAISSFQMEDFIPNAEGYNMSAVFTYLRVDCYESGGNTLIDTYVTEPTFEGIDRVPPAKWKLLVSFSVEGKFSSHDRIFYGWAFMSGGSQNEFIDIFGNPHSDIDFSSSTVVDYIAMRTNDLGPPPSGLGACCPATGGPCFHAGAIEECGPPNWFFEYNSCSDIIAPCETFFPTGAICRESDGDCKDNLTEEAANQLIGYGDCPLCGWTAGLDCSSRDCPDATDPGRCCTPSGGCLETTLTDCANLWGETIPPAAFVIDETCTDNARDFCSINFNGIGACCYSGICSVVSEFSCDSLSGTFQGVDTDCLVGDPCGLNGACCKDGSCTVGSLDDCLNLGGKFQGSGSNCSPNPCAPPPAEGACCLNAGGCIMLPEAFCTPSVGTWFYSETSCFPDPCVDPTGACCHFDGGCENDVTLAECSGPGESYKGDGTSCIPGLCPQPTGGCCVGTNCTNETLSNCLLLGGIYQGDFNFCITNMCAPPSDPIDPSDDPYGETSVLFKPEDLWTIEVADEQFVTRVLYHIQEKIEFGSVRSGVSTGNRIDFMFIIDHSGSMGEEIINVLLAVPELARQIKKKGFDIRFGYVVYGRVVISGPHDKIRCSRGKPQEENIFNGLQDTRACQPGNSGDLTGGIDGIVNSGFTRSVNYLQQAMNCWGTPGGQVTESPWAAVNFALDPAKFAWRSDAAKFMFLVTDTGNDGLTNCGYIGDPEQYSNTKEDAVANIENSNVTMILAIDNIFEDEFVDVSVNSGWNGPVFDVASNNYGDIFIEVAESIDSKIRIEHATIVERSKAGTDATFLKKAEFIVTYDGDLSDLWTFNKVDFEFPGDHVPFAGTNTKQLSNFPFPLASGKIYGIDSVHIQDNPNNWVSFGKQGALLYDRDTLNEGIGKRASGTSLNPLLISTNSVRPKVYVNNRNQVMVAYENNSTGTPQIEIKGTGDFHQNSITGPKANRITRLLNLDDFSYLHPITLPGEGINQLCDFVIDNSDITHVVWQSNRDGYWEIYYANSSNMFNPVRITKINSRSSHPSIDIDETGSIFVVYHDNRFGSFNIMLSSKDEERVIPLLEQDAYLASMTNKYVHYTNIVPVFLDNPSKKAPNLGRFWANKDEDDAGNDSETFIYQISETTGIPNNGVDLKTLSALLRPVAIAFSSANLWGITSYGRLVRLGTIGEDNKVDFSPTALTPPIFLVLHGFHDATVLDMAIDKFDRIWVLIHEIRDLDNTHRLRLEYVSGFNGARLARGILKENDVDGANGGSLVITLDNKFYITWGNSSNVTLSSSEYPSISEKVAFFSFVDIGILTPAIIPVAMTADSSDTLFSVTSDNDLYTIDKLTGEATLQTSLTSGSGDEPILPVGTTAGIAYQVLSVKATEKADFFHIRIDFYDNISFEGDAFLSVDSRDNLEAFINEETIDDPYLDPYTPFGMDARGIFLEIDVIGIVFFDVANFVPGFSRLSQPYSFEPNQTYFLKVFLINEDGKVRESLVAQTNSFSCTKCSRFGNNNFNTSSCSYSFVVPNPEADTKSFNFQIDFYADTGKQYLIRRFEAIPGSDDLQYMEVDNKPAIEEWTEFGLPILAGDSAFIQIHPVLDPTAGFLCGVTYTVQVNGCRALKEICSDFSKIHPSNWVSSFIGSSETIDDQISDEKVMLGLSMKLINNKLSVAWITPESNLKFAQYDGKDWAFADVFFGSTKVAYCELAEVNGSPTIAYTFTTVFGGTYELVSTLDSNVPGGSMWSSWGNLNTFRSDLLPNPRSLLEYNGAPMVAFIGLSLLRTGQPTFTLNSGRSITWDTTASCHPPFSPITGGSCTTTLATINGFPAVAWIGGNSVRYATWDVNNENFTNINIISADETVMRGKVALAEVNGQPAIAYIQTVGNLGLLKYKTFNGISWINTPTNGQAQDFNKHVAMTTINGQPYIAYSIKTSPTTSQLRFAFYNGTKFVDDLVENNVNQVDHVVDIIEFNNEPAIVISANPFKIYFFRTQPSQSVNEIRPVFFCECSSKIFTNRLTHLNEVARWESSAHGFADTPVTDSSKDSLRPTMRTRKTGAAIVIWEDHNKSNNCTSPPCIRAATFRNVNQDQLRASGTKSWFDYDFGISGQDSDLALDLYERVNLIYEKPKLPLSLDELPGNEIFGKVCDFSSTAEEFSADIPGGCDHSLLENNVVSFDQFISSEIVRKIRVKDDSVLYHTYNASGILTPIVSTCNIALEIHGTPEIVALRFRNESEVAWGAWCPWSPQISDFVMEKEHKISRGSGIKEICVQAMTYVGITTEFCLPIVADYETIVFETKFYKNTDSEGNKITDFSDVTNGLFPAELDAKLVPLPLSEGISVASLDLKTGGTPCPEGIECSENETCIHGRCVAKITTILVEIVPNKEFNEETIIFDVIQQGTNNQKQTSKRGKNNDGRVLYRGEFTIEREDKAFNADGLARINPTFPGACENADGEAIGVSNTYTRDTFNEIGGDVAVEKTEATDPLANFRQTSGRIGVSLDIRSSEDPYFVFGDPDYSTRKKDGRRLGVPFKIAEINIETGTSPDQDAGGPVGGGA